MVDRGPNPTQTYSSEIGGIFIDSFDSLLSVHVVGPLHPFSNFQLSYVHSKNDIPFTCSAPSIENVLPSGFCD